METETETENDNIVDDINAAFDSSEGSAHEDDHEMDGDTLAAQTKNDPVPGIDEKDEKPAETAAETSPDVKSDAKAEAEPADKQKAPASWGAKSRESWGKVPPAAQAEIMKREQEVNQVLQNSAGARKMAQGLNQVLSPFKDGLMAAGYQEPLQAVQAALTTEHSLRMGSAQQRAQTAADLIKNYGVDIHMLDSLLAGQPVANPEQDALTSMIDQRMQPVNQLMQQMQQQQVNHGRQEAQRAQGAVASFGQNAEFLNDVRMDMADLMDMASQRGQAMSMQQAYDKACSIHPQVSLVLAERQKEAQVMGTNNTMAGKRNAASSIAGTRGGAGGTPNDLDLRQQIEDAWNTQTG